MLGSQLMVNSNKFVPSTFSPLPLLLLYVAIGKAFSEDLVPHHDMLQLSQSSLVLSSNNWNKRTMLPRSAKVYVSSSCALLDPLITFENIHCYPEIADLFNCYFNTNRVNDVVNLRTQSCSVAGSFGGAIHTVKSQANINLL